MQTVRRYQPLERHRHGCDRRAMWRTTASTAGRGMNAERGSRCPIWKIERCHPARRTACSTLCPTRRRMLIEYEVGGHELVSGDEQSPQQPGGHRERRIRDDPKGSARQTKIGGIGLHDDDRCARETASQCLGASGMKFHRDDPCARSHERRSDRTRSRADVEHEITRSNVCGGDQTLRRLASETMPSPA